jgi:hypothetical protein
MTVMISAKALCSRCGSNDAPKPLPKQYGCETCGQRLLCYACDTTHGAWCGVAEPVEQAPAPDFREQGCRFPDAPHTCFYVCEEEECSERVEDDEVRADEIKCSKHRTVRTVGDIQPHHVGWLVKVQHERTQAGFFISSHDTFVLGKGFTRGPSQGCVRKWTRPDGSDWVGLTDDDTEPGIVGTEHHYSAETPCELVRLVKKPTRRRR